MKIFFKILLICFFTLFIISFIFAESTEKHGFKDKILEKIIALGSNVYLKYLVVLIISMMPIFELRGSIPVGILSLHLNPVLVVIVSIIGNMLPIFFILFIFGIVEKFLRRFKIFDKFFNWLFKRTLAKSKSIERYQELGLMFFVAIPAPITGAWTGSLLSYLLKLSYVKSISFIFLGVLIAAAIVTPITLYFRNISKMPLSLTIIFGVLIAVLVISYVIFMVIQKNRAKTKEEAVN